MPSKSVIRGPETIVPLYDDNELCCHMRVTAPPLRPDLLIPICIEPKDNRCRFKGGRGEAYILQRDGSSRLQEVARCTRPLPLDSPIEFSWGSFRD